jgi:hypothetical protein
MDQATISGYLQLERERERERLKKRDILSANPDARALSLAKALDKRYAQMLAMGTETSCLRDTETPQLPSAIQSPQELQP